MHTVFVYGTLTFDEVWSRLLAGKYQWLRGRLAGYRCWRINGQVYPGLRDCSGGEVQGKLMFGLSSRDMRVLDRFEGFCYRRRQVRVLAEDDRNYSAETYVIREKYRHLLAKSEWDRAEFSRRHLHRFVSSLC